MLNSTFASRVKKDPNAQMSEYMKKLSTMSCLNLIEFSKGVSSSHQRYSGGLIFVVVIRAFIVRTPFFPS